MGDTIIDNLNNKRAFIFLLIPVILPFSLYLLNINIDIMMNYYILSFLMMSFAFMLMPKIKSNVINSGIGFIMILFSYLFSFLIYPKEIRVELIFVQLIVIIAIFYLLNKIIPNEILLDIHNNKYLFILYWFFYVASSSLICSIEIFKLNNVRNMFTVIIISILLGWYGKSILFDKFRGYYAYAKVFALQLLLFLMIGFIYDIIIGDLMGLKNISLDGPSVWIMSILQVSSLLISRICYEEYGKIQ